MNICGLVLIGLGLFLGMFTRIASISGIIFAADVLYCQSAFYIGSGIPSEANCSIVNLNLIEAGILVVFRVDKAGLSLEPGPFAQPNVSEKEGKDLPKG